MKAYENKQTDQSTEQGVQQPIRMCGPFSRDDNKDILVHNEKDQPLNKQHQDNWQKCKSKKTKKQKFTPSNY